METYKGTTAYVPWLLPFCKVVGIKAAASFARVCSPSKTLISIDSQILYYPGGCAVKCLDGPRVLLLAMSCAKRVRMKIHNHFFEQAAVFPQATYGALISIHLQMNQNEFKPLY